MVRERSSRRQRLIEVGMDLFCKHTYEEVAIDDIAEVADISKGLLYYYFPTKHDFYIAVVQHAAEQLLQATADAGAELEPLERLRAGLDAYFTYVENHAQAYVALLRGGVGVDTQVASIVDAARQTQTQRILRGIARETPLSPLHHIAISGWIGFVEATCIAWLERRDVDREQLSDFAMTAFTTVLSAVLNKIQS